MLLYIHVPFCRRKCTYCAFHSEPLVPVEEQVLAFGSDNAPQPEQERMRQWLDGILLELAHWADLLGKQEVQSVFFGGGTPSLLHPEMVKIILSRVRRYFRLMPHAEITMEANPESVNLARARGWMRAGVNRFSLGVQSLDDESLLGLGRVHSVADVHRAYNALRSARCHNINLDLIWGLPGQSVKAWLAQLGDAIRLRPEHISCYGLTIEPDTPLAQAVDMGVAVLPTEREQATMYMRGGDMLEEAGYLHYEISNFARMGYQCRHNTGYWEGEDYLGVGPAATSTLGNKRWTNPCGLEEWIAQINRGSIGLEAENLTVMERVLEMLMLRLRTTRGLRFKAYRQLTGRDFLKDHETLVHMLHRNGLIRIRHGYLWLTRNGMLVSNSILERFFQNAREQLGVAVKDEGLLVSSGVGENQILLPPLKDHGATAPG